VVDDEPAIRDLLSAILADHGYRIRTAPDGLAALAAVSADPPDLVLADVMMPRLGGDGLLTRLRLHGYLMPVVLMSAACAAPEVAGMTAFVPKPFDADRLLALLSRFVGHASARS
jgi:two-component system response regulator MprA